jgi:hypothetical protein
LIKKLAKNHVKTDYYIVDLIYNDYLNDGEKKTKAKLKKRKPIDWVDFN